ncbi:hypothetical protein VNO78_19651 [Psophocarpus tetragonolobus]|uniref:Pectinesterase inhibitor domain-containing protein n=1 Tax=Psophocarpus tetragonolobus TaxID=3891 RepID=A0AAN9XGD1_PSOTE
MNSSILCSLMLTLCLITTLHFCLPTEAKAHNRHRRLGGNPDLIDQICQQTFQDKVNCMNLLRADPATKQAKNLLEFSKAVLELALKKGIQGQNFLKGLAQKNNDPAIRECANSDYDGVVRSFKSALAELKVDPETSSYDAKVASDGSNNCAKAITNAHIVNPAISSLNYQISLLSKIASLASDK